MLRAGEVTAMDYWELFCDTGAPEAYLLFKDAGRAQQSVREAEHGLPDDAGACPPDNRI